MTQDPHAPEGPDQATINSVGATLRHCLAQASDGSRIVRTGNPALRDLEIRSVHRFGFDLVQVWISRFAPPELVALLAAQGCNVKRWQVQDDTGWWFLPSARRFIGLGPIQVPSTPDDNDNSQFTPEPISEQTTDQQMFWTALRHIITTFEVADMGHSFISPGHDSGLEVRRSNNLIVVDLPSTVAFGALCAFFDHQQRAYTVTDSAQLCIPIGLPRAA